MKKSYVWDLPTRLFHWSLFILVCVSLYTGFTGGFTVMDYHMLSGYSILTLVAFRVAWGFVGSRNSRFTTFIKGPSQVVAHLKEWRRPANQVGHNPLGGLSVVALLIVLAVQAATGLFANDDILTEGPLVHLVSDDTSDALTEIHEANLWLLITLVVLHLAAIAYHRLVKKDNLVLPMITGWKGVGQDVPPERNNVLLAGLLLGMAAGAVYYLVNYV